MPKNIFFGALDTARTAELNGDSAKDYISIGEAKLKLAVLLGLTPIFPQTYGWDSSALLQYARPKYLADGQDESEAFLWLVENGFIRILLRRHQTPKSLLAAAIDGLEDKRYIHLSAWPDFNLDDQRADRKAFVAAMRAGAQVPPKKVPSALWNKGLALRRLSDAVEKATKTHTEREAPRQDQLRKEIENAAKAAKRLGEKVIADLLQRCIDLGEEKGNRREEIDGFLRNARIHLPIRAEVHEITDACFNIVSAKCVSATPELTFAFSRNIARAVMQQTRPQLSIPGNVFDGRIKPPKDADLGNLKPLTWLSVKAFAQKHGAKNPFHAERLNELPNLIANVQVEGAEGYLIPIVAAAGGAVIGNMAAEKMSRRRSLALGVRGIIAGLAALAGGKALKSIILEANQCSIKKRWLDLLYLDGDTVT